MSAVGFYTTVIRGNRVGYLLGPFDDEPTARAAMPAARRLAEQVDPFTVFDAFGTCRVELRPGPLPRGKLMDRYEKEPN